MAAQIPPPNTPTFLLPHKRNRFYSLPQSVLLSKQYMQSLTKHSSDEQLPMKTATFHNKTYYSDSEVESKDRAKYKHVLVDDNDSELMQLPKICTCPYFGNKPLQNCVKPAEVKIISTTFKVTTTSPGDIVVSSVGDESSLRQ